ncbi:MAG TPA: DNA-protecting protein DprA, partial [Pseudomonadales bacterium]|nr:DNA-protecting protein DprA [Pseudomonadales bacterium]
MSQPLAVDEQRLWLALLHTPGLGPRRLLRLLQALGSPAAIIEANMDRLRALGLDGELLANLLRNREADPPWRTLVENDLSWLERDALHLLSWGSPAYPPLLAQTAT